MLKFSAPVARLESFLPLELHCSRGWCHRVRWRFDGQSGWNVENLCPESLKIHISPSTAKRMPRETDRRFIYPAVAVLFPSPPASSWHSVPSLPSVFSGGLVSRSCCCSTIASVGFHLAHCLPMGRKMATIFSIRDCTAL